jgi:putative peptidoglycan lipid II flippase
VALAELGEPLVVLLFERGHFDPESSYQTGRALMWQGGAIFTVAATRQLVPAFHAVGDTRTPVVVSALDLLAFIGLALGLKGTYGHVGISIAVAGSSAVQMLFLVIGLRMRLGALRGAEILASAARVVGASCIAGAAAWAVARLLTDVPRWLPGIAASLAFVALFVVAAWALGARELAEIGAPLKRRLRRRRGGGIRF